MMRGVWMCLITLLATSAVNAMEQKLKIYISADMEGIGGVISDVQAEPKGRDYEKFRRLMTDEVNAAIAGACDAGATEIWVNDGHGDSQNLDLELLDKRARLVLAYPGPLLMMDGIDPSFDAVIFIGYHASEGQASAVLAHTMWSERVVEIKLNGVSVPEAAFNAAIAGEYGVPVVFLAGDQTATEEAARLLGPIETARVKQAIGFHAAVMMHPTEAQRLIRAGVKRGVENRRELKPYKVEHPVKLEITFKSTVTAEIVSYFPGVERPHGNTILYTAKDMVATAKFCSAIFYLNTL
jgi:D-amino peptidase